MIIRTREDLDIGLAELVLLDPRLQPVVAAAGPLPLRLSPAGFAGLAHIVVSQMVSRQSADAIWARILAAIGVPTAEAFLALDADVVGTLGLSRAKTACLVGLAERVVSGELDIVGVASLPADQARQTLMQLRGIGSWTAEVYLMFCGGHPDVFPAGDVALRAAVSDALGSSHRLDIATVGDISRVWQPWRSVAARLFWAYYAVRSGRNAVPAEP